MMLTPADLPEVPLPETLSGLAERGARLAVMTARDLAADGRLGCACLAHTPQRAEEYFTVLVPRIRRWRESLERSLVQLAPVGGVAVVTAVYLLDSPADEDPLFAAATGDPVACLAVHVATPGSAVCRLAVADLYRSRLSGRWRTVACTDEPLAQLCERLLSA